MAIIFFGATARVAYRGPPQAFTMPTSPSAANVGGSTNYAAGFAEAATVMAHPDYAGRDKAIVFLTDGFPNDATHIPVCDGILASRKDVNALYCIYFGGGSGPAPAVVELANQFQRHLIPTELVTPQNRVEVEKHLKQAAHAAGPIHRHAKFIF